MPPNKYIRDVKRHRQYLSMYSSIRKKYLSYCILKLVIPSTEITRTFFQVRFNVLVSKKAGSMKAGSEMPKMQPATNEGDDSSNEINFIISANRGLVERRCASYGFII